MLFFFGIIFSINVILLKDKLKITNHNIYDGDDGPTNYDDVNDDDDIFGCNVPVNEIDDGNDDGGDDGVGYPAAASSSDVAHADTSAAPTPTTTSSPTSTPPTTRRRSLIGKSLLLRLMAISPMMILMSVLHRVMAIVMLPNCHGVPVQC